MSPVLVPRQDLEGESVLCFSLSFFASFPGNRWHITWISTFMCIWCSLCVCVCLCVQISSLYKYRSHVHPNDLCILRYWGLRFKHLLGGLNSTHNREDACYQSRVILRNLEYLFLGTRKHVQQCFIIRNSLVCEKVKDFTRLK